MENNKDMSLYEEKQKELKDKWMTIPENYLKQISNIFKSDEVEQCFLPVFFVDKKYGEWLDITSVVYGKHVISPVDADSSSFNQAKEVAFKESYHLTNNNLTINHIGCFHISSNTLEYIEMPCNGSVYSYIDLEKYQYNIFQIFA